MRKTKKARDYEKTKKARNYETTKGEKHMKLRKTQNARETGPCDSGFAMGQSTAANKGETRSIIPNAIRAT